MNFTDQEIDGAWNALLFDIPAERIKVIEEVKKNYKILLLSNSNEIHYDLYVRDLQLRFGYREFDELFDKAYFSFDLHLAKPDPDIYEFVMYQHKLKPEETLLIDDRTDNIEAMKVGVKYGGGDVSPLSLAAHYETIDKGANALADQIFLTGGYQFGVHTVSLNYGITQPDGNGDDGSYVALGLKHAFNKSVSALVGISKTDNADFSDATDDDYTTAGVSMRVKF
jgi:hypothetical protein